MLVKTNEQQGSFCHLFEQRVPTAQAKGVLCNDKQKVDN